MDQVFGNLKLDEVVDGEPIEDNPPKPNNGSPGSNQPPNTPNADNTEAKETINNETNSETVKILKEAAKLQAEAARISAANVVAQAARDRANDRKRQAERAKDARIRADERVEQARQARDARIRKAHEDQAKRFSDQQARRAEAKAQQTLDEIKNQQTRAADEQQRAADELERPRRQQEAREKARRTEQAAVMASTNPEKHPITLINKLSDIQNQIDRERRGIARGTSRDQGYKSSLYKDGQKFVDTLLEPSVLANLDDVQLSEAGFDMIAHALTHGRVPDVDTLVNLKKVIDSQDIVLIRGTGAQPRYTSRDKKFLKMFNDTGLESEVLSKDSVAEVLKMLRPEYWKLSKTERDHYIDVLNLKKTAHKPGDTTKLHRYHPVRTLKGPVTIKPGVSHEDPKDLNLTEEIIKWWKQTDKIRRQTKTGIKDKKIILAAAQEDAAARLWLDNNLP
jgi:hypothetical protein